MKVRIKELIYLLLGFPASLGFSALFFRLWKIEPTYTLGFILIGVYIIGYILLLINPAWVRKLLKLKSTEQKEAEKRKEFYERIDPKESGNI